MIAIVAPYDRSDTSLAAVRVAELCLSLGHDVSWLSPEPVRAGIDDRWDSRVRCVPRDVRTRPLEGFDRLDYAIHFSHNPAVHAAFDTAKDGVKQILVLPWKSHPKDFGVVADYDTIVCPTKSGVDEISSKVRKLGLAVGKLSYVSWAGKPSVPVRRAKPVRRVCVAFDREAADATFGMWTHMLDEALAKYHQTAVTVYTPGALSKGDAKRARELNSVYGNRLLFAKGGGRVCWQSAFAAADCVVLPSLSAEFGSMASLARTCGTPVMCHDFEPLVGHPSDLPVPCGVRCRSSGAPVAVPDFGKWQSAIDRLLSSGFPSPRTVAKGTVDFDAAWDRILS